MAEPAAKRVALVTGAGTGIGAGIARRLAASGHALALCGLAQAELDTAGGEIAAAGGEYLAMAGDIAEPAFRSAWVDAALSRWGRIDALVNNAGISGVAASALAIDETLAHFDRMMSVNLTAAYFLAQLAAQAMRRQGGGAIVNISSVGGQAAQFGGAAYCITKAGLDAMARSLALEWAEYGIRINSVAPGDIRTETSDASTAHRNERRPHPYVRTTPLGRQGTPADIGETVNFLVSDAASFITGATIRVDGGFLIY